MREILFRGKRLDNGEWVYGSLLIQKGEYISKNEVTPNEYYIFGRQGEHYLVIPKTVGQCTGLTDKHGKKIFEGDIVDGSGDYPMSKGSVEFCDGAFEINHFCEAESPSLLASWDNHIEVVDNIYDCVVKKKKYRKKPIVVEAYQFISCADLKFHSPDWLRSHIGKEIIVSWGKNAGAYIQTLEGKMKVSIGDYIIKGVDGEFYPCKPDIFEKTYELVEGKDE